MDLESVNAKLDLVLKQQQEILDRQAIWDVTMAYCRGMDRMDTELALSAYHPDAIHDHGFVVARAPQFVPWANAIHATFASHQIMITNHIVELDGDVAHAENYFLVTGTGYEGQMSMSSGRYLDRLERRDGKWAIAARKCVVEWGGGDVPIQPIPDDIRALQTAAFRPARDPSDPSYERPLTVDPGRVGLGLTNA